MRVEYVCEDETVVLEFPEGYQPPTHIDLWHYTRRTERLFLNRAYVRTN